MKVLIPFSGGINSTYALWRWLSETDHEIHSYRLHLYNEPEERKVVAARNMVQWLKDNVRDFNFWEEGGLVEPLEEEILMPVRRGFTNKMIMQSLVPRWTKRIDVINREKPDAFVFGLSLETTHSDYPSVRMENWRTAQFADRDDLDYYFAGSRVLDTPYPSAWFMDPLDPSDWMAEKWDVIGADFMGRFEQWELIPDELKAMYELPHIPRHDHTHTFCIDCLWEDIQTHRTDLTGREKDLALAELGHYGPWRSGANPETYTGAKEKAGAAVELLKDYLKWPEGIEW